MNVLQDSLAGQTVTGEFHRGWRIVVLGLAGVLTSTSAALLYGFGTLVIPLQDAFGWSRGELQTSITFLFAGVAIGSQLLGGLYARYGLRRVALVSLVLQVLCYASLTLLGGSIYWLYLAFFLMPLLAVGTIAITWTQLVSLWFERNRGVALAIILSGSGLAAMVMPPLLAWSIAHGGWRWAFLLLAAMPLLLTLPMAVAWLKFPAQRSTATESSTTEPVVEGTSFALAIRTRVFWGCNLALILSVSLIVGMVTTIVPYLQDKGVPSLTASQVFSSFGISIIVGRLLVGYLLDRFPPHLIAAASLCVPAVGCLLFMFTGPQAIGVLVLATVCIGFSAGAEFDIAAFLIARYFGLRDYARIFGLHLGLVTVISGLAPAMFGHLFTLFGNYNPVLFYCLGCAVVAPLVMLTLGSAPLYRKVSV
ncbi:MFS transporter [Pseudomonas sp. LP_7_YM]|uniref:MFS transporter n=1 Tax=Pseudomonas sp. LP_7_YM TaxID=2485137 RepID=UPI00105EC1F3|nr:MFS transporter [Pseudomonas sp. LP_7_YM]TDV72607.1 putative MFS family arabinose efflux permease [Pseudomonas sp. LP_7_YM]